MGKICCCTGCRPQNFPWDYNNASYRANYLLFLKKAVRLLCAHDFTVLISGGAIGVDIDFAETVISEKAHHNNLKLEIAVPCPNQDLKWHMDDKNRYHRLLASADYVKAISDHYSRFCMQKRNEYMVNQSDLILAFWNGIEHGGTWNTIRYARARRKKIFVCNLNSIIL